MSAVPRRIGALGKEILVLYMSIRKLVFVEPKVMGASLSMGVIWFRTMSVGRRVVDALNANLFFFPGLITNV